MKKLIDVSEGIDIDETKASKECMLFHYWYFKDVGLKFEPHVCNKNIAILNVEGVDFICNLWGKWSCKQTE